MVVVKSMVWKTSMHKRHIGEASATITCCDVVMTMDGDGLWRGRFEGRRRRGRSGFLVAWPT
jgi:hypothetical protein